MTRTDPDAVTVDHHSPTYAVDGPRLLAQAREQPVRWMPLYGGYWLATSYSAVRQIVRDEDTFSSVLDPEAEPDDGITMPTGRLPTGEKRPPQGPIEMTPAEARPYQKLMRTHLSPKRCDALGDRVAEIAGDYLDRVYPSGRLDVVEYAGLAPTRLTLQDLLGLPDGDWATYTRAVHHMTTQPPGTDEYTAAVGVFIQLAELMGGLIAERVEAPRDDASTLIDALAAGVRAWQADPEHAEKITLERAVQTCTLVVAGGIETTSAVFAVAMDLLAGPEHRQVRQRIVDDPEVRKNTIAELLRYVAPAQCLARTATRDVELEGQSIKAGQRVLMSFAGANRDPAMFPDPDTLDVDRPNAAKHMSFGEGVHRCVGASLGVVELDRMLPLTFDRLGDFEVDRDTATRVKSAATSNGYDVLTATFTPRSPEAPRSEGWRPLRRLFGRQG